MRCKFAKSCNLYKKNSHTCKEEQITDDGYIYCGKYREKMMENQNKRRKK